MSLNLRLEGVSDTLDLDSIRQTDTGYQALSGVVGLGLPTITSQWSEGAGDGALYRGRRVRARDIDIPLDILGRDRDHLRELMSRLARVLAGKMRLVVTEPDGRQWYTDVVRTGGGGFVYGQDTIGVRDAQVVITVTAGDPYFTSTDVRTQVIGQAGSPPAFLGELVKLRIGSSSAIGSITIENDGDADTYPVWTVIGPGRDFEITSPNGERLRWEGTLAAGEVLTVDTRTASVTDGSGTNRYADLAAAPRFWSSPPGSQSITASLADTTSASQIVCSWQARKWLVI